MSESTPAQKKVITGLFTFSALAIVVGLIQLVTTPKVEKTVQAANPASAQGKLLNATGPHLAYIPLEGMIIEETQSNGVFNQESDAIRARRLLYQAANDNNIKGVLLRINSPGGTVGMSQELYNAVLTVRKAKPIVVSMGDVAASGGYYTASAADKIVANPGTLTASIGVILQSLNLQKLMENKLGVKPLTVKSGKYKDILSPYRPTSKDDLKLLQNIIDTSYRQFLNAVLQGRTQDLKTAEEKLARVKSITAIADGRVVIGEEALKVGLVDQLGGAEEAKTLLQHLAIKRFDLSPTERLPLQEYENGFNWQDAFGMNSQSHLQLPAFLGAQAGGDKQWLPVSLRYANRPLFLMETIY